LPLTKVIQQELEKNGLSQYVIGKKFTNFHTINLLNGYYGFVFDIRHSNAETPNIEDKENLKILAKLKNVLESKIVKNTISKLIKSHQPLKQNNVSNIIKYDPKNPRIKLDFSSKEENQENQEAKKNK
jgi:hypothetical protein